MCLLSSIHFKDKYAEPSDSGPARHKRISRASRTQMTRSTLSLPVAPRAQPRAFTGSDRNKKNGATSVGAGPLGPREVSRILFEAGDRGMKGEPPVMRLPGYARSSPKIHVYAQATSPANEKERERRGEARGDLRVRRRIDARAHTHATSLLSRRHSRHASRFISFFALEKAYFSGIRLRPSLGVRKRARPSRVLFNLAYTAAAPLRSAARRYVLLLQRGKAVLGESSLSDRSTENRAV